MAMISGNQYGFGQAGGVPAYPATGPAAPPPPPPPPLPGETVQLSSAPAAPAPAPEIVTRSGVRALHSGDQYRVGMQATLPAGALLPAPVMIQLLQTPQGASVQAQVSLHGEQKTLPAQLLNDGRVAVQMENNPSSPLLMFNPGNLDYGLATQPKHKDGGLHRSLEETIHADGSRTLFQDARFGADGSTSYNHVQQGADGSLKASHVRQDGTGRVIENTPLQASTTPDGMLHLQGAAPQTRSLKEHITSGNFSWTRGPLLNWLSEKKQASAQPQSGLSTTFATFGSMMRSLPHKLFPTLATPPAPAPVPTPPQTAASSAPPPPPPPPLDAPVAATVPQAPASTSPLRTSVVTGDITKLPADALITGINSGQMWFGGIDGAIQRAAGGQYHAQAAAGDLMDGNTIVARGQQPHQGAFKDVVFVVDDGGLPLSELVFRSLQAADQAGHKSVNVPAMHTGVLAGPEGPGPAVQGMAEGIQRFRESGASNLQDVRVVVYNDPALAQQYQSVLG